MDSINDRANQWIAGGDVGASSKAIWSVMQGMKPEQHAYPSDGSDLGRCIRLLRLIPEWRPRLGEMSSVSSYWAALVPAWDDLESWYGPEDHEWHKMVYKKMRAILDPIEGRDPNIIRMGNGASIRFGR
jgi:hypothetical protein